ncbi:uncharacterized protein LOC110733122 isoform X3 [Chenopodium quinoa]|uniref:uncharacterized protein LOC110733122 isoform X3 n=1 Tax=Chenopodium quinoa TaxID=63459 RepID=UPI000B776C19|nr:uncharacterized protein LOC110733122 isoform X3 [Chenopodium quinoa]
MTNFRPSNTRDPPLKQLPRVCCEALLVLFAAVSINHNVRKDMACSSILQAPGMVSFLCHQWRILAENNIRCYDEANDSVVRDRLSQLSDDLLMLIMSSLTMKEVTKTSALSHRWKNLCRFLPVLLFEAHSPILKWVMGECKLKSTYNMNLKDHEWFILRHRPGLENKNCIIVIFFLYFNSYIIIRKFCQQLPIKARVLKTTIY